MRPAFFPPANSPSGGPYQIPAGATLTLDASASSAATGSTITAYQWDLDADGQFNDAAGVHPTIQVGATSPATVGVQVTSSNGRTAVAYAPLTVTDTTGLVITQVTPADDQVEVAAGTTSAFCPYKPRRGSLVRALKSAGVIPRR